ncbi:MAG: subclass B1 metallo-beta-lactamase [Chloroflexia bacterium]|nr:subclass B1 metallo-beta-lactamase [Chloroflexia bacterium]
MLKTRNTSFKTVIVYSIIVIVHLLPLQVAGQEEFNKIKINNDLELIQLNESFFIHVSWTNSEKFGRFSSNGAVVIKNGKALIIDTPMEEALTTVLYNYLHDSMKVEIEKFIAGHYHDDCMGGINVLHAKNVRSIALDLTKQKCIEQNLPLPQQIFSDSLTFSFYGETVKCIYAGPGHTIDNISVYFPDSKILFGGCLLKSMSSKGLGNTADAVVNEWDKSVEKLMILCGNAKIVIPGHGNFGNIDLLSHTIKLVKESRGK